VGPKIVQKIYKEFKSLKPIANLEIKEISKTISINEDLAKKIQKAIKGIYN
jgi:excinuclease UvrABC nuclease subunit